MPVGPGEGPPPGHRLLCNLKWQKRGKWALLGLICISTNPIQEATPSWPNKLPKAPTPNTIILGVRISVYEL